MRGNEDSDPFRMSELMDSDEQVPDGVGCTEIWEYMSEVREGDEDDTAEGECREDDTTDMIPAGYVVDDETGEVPGVDLDDDDEDEGTDYGETIVPGERVEAESVDLILEGDDAEEIETMSVEEASVSLVEPEELEFDDDLDRNEFRYESGDTTYEGSFEIEFEPDDEFLDAISFMLWASHVGLV